MKSSCDYGYMKCTHGLILRNIYPEMTEKVKIYGSVSDKTNGFHYMDLTKQIHVLIIS